MARKMSIKKKIQLFILTSTLIIFAATIGFISSQGQQRAKREAKRLADTYLKVASSTMEQYLNQYAATVKSLQQTFVTFEAIPSASRREVLSEFMQKQLNENEDILSFWTTWEPNALDKNDRNFRNLAGSTIIGNFAPMYFKQNGQLKLDRSIETDSLKIFSGNHYLQPKQTRRPLIMEPYYYSYTDSEADLLLETSFVYPLIADGNFLGVLGADIHLEQFQPVIDKIRPNQASIPFLISNQGNYITHLTPKYVGKNILDLFPEQAKTHDIIAKIKKGAAFSYTFEDENGQSYYTSYAPVHINDMANTWSVGIAVPLDIMIQDARKTFWWSILAGLAGLILLSIIISIITNNITSPIKKVTNFLSQLGEGHIDSSMKLSVKTGDEIEQMANALNRSVEGLVAKSSFAKDIGNGILTSELNLLSKEDELGKSLLEMRANLQQAEKANEARIEEDKKRQWANEGMAQIGSVLRENHDNLKDLSFHVVQFLVNYLDANQGGIFLNTAHHDDDKPAYSLQAAYAYNRRKHQKKTFAQGEGLVGTCAIEKKYIHITEIPDNYIKITSGLGDANPSSLLLIPLIQEEIVVGVMEFASFHKFAPHQIEFMEKIGETIAATITAERINEKTANLLEQSQQQAEELAAQEEEMRQNMEELQATQEEAARKGAEMEGFISALNNTSYIAEYDTHGAIIDINESYLRFLGITRDQALGTHHTYGLSLSSQQKEQYEEFWQQLRKGKIQKQKTELKHKGVEYIFLESYTPVYNQYGDVAKILKIAYDITPYASKNN